MSKKARSELSRLLSRVPNVDSPPALDQKILAQSRRLAPERQGRNLRGWIPVTATICMVGLAVFVAKPVLFDLKQTQRVQTSPVLQKQEGVSVSDSSKSVQPQDTDSSGVTVLDDVMYNEIVTPETTSRILPTTEMAVSPDALMDGESENMPAVEMRQELKAKKSSSEEKEDHPASGFSSTTAESDSVIMEQDNVSVGASIPEPRMTEPVSVEQNVSKDDFAIALEEIKSLIEAGDLETAASQLEALRLRCPGCEVPDSLEDF